MFCRFLLVIAIALSSSLANAQYGFLLNKTYAQRYLAIDTTFFTNKVPNLDSTLFFKEIEQIAQLARKANDKELLLETRFLRYEYYMVGKQENHKVFESKMLGLREEADKHKILQLQIRTRQKLGYYYFYISHQYGPGFENYLTSYELLKNVSARDIPDKQELIANIGSAYWQFGDNDKAIRYLAEAQTVHPGSYKKRFPINLTNTVGLVYQEEKKFDKAKEYFLKANAMAQAARDSTWMGIASGNLGLTYFLQGQLDKALPLLEFNARECIKANEIDNALGALIDMARIYQIKGNRTKVTELIKQTESLLSSTGNPYVVQRDLYSIKARHSASEGDYQKAYLFADSAQVIKDSLNNRKNTMLMAKAEQTVEVERYQAKVQHLVNENKFQQLTLWSISIAVLLLMVIAALFYNRRRLVYYQRQKQVYNEKLIAEAELQLATLQVESFTRSIQEKNLLIEQIEAELEAERSSGSVNAATAHIKSSALQQLLQATILTEEQWDNFRLLFEKVHEGFLARLQQKYHNLTPAEIRYVVLSKLNLTNKEMAAMLGVQPDTMRLHRHRLRKKLNLTEEDGLIEFINSI